MGQYYKAIVLSDDFKENETTPIVAIATPWDYDNGAKLMEHSYVGNHLTLQMENELATTHYGKRFVWGGDYADENPLWKEKEDGEEWELNCYGKCNQMAKTDTSLIIEPSDYDELKKAHKYHKFIVNLDKKEFVKMPRTRNKWPYAVHPLPLLCADGNGRGGGDYREDGKGVEFIGRWAFDHIGVTDEIPEGFEEIKPNFKENR